MDNEKTTQRERKVGSHNLSNRVDPDANVVLDNNGDRFVMRAAQVVDICAKKQGVRDESVKNILQEKDDTQSALNIISEWLSREENHPANVFLDPSASADCINFVFVVPAGQSELDWQERADEVREALLEFEMAVDIKLLFVNYRAMASLEAAAANSDGPIIGVR